ncbi:FtsK/SpoIIIE family DNA translocase [Telluribacter sp.]|jgi:S-DNA-T family DNA segregation ATPase FtsK/SpoIIIE|uniref:FtsK/SpoIIIE family DNA translocase n=1 Tax=Telluribacter sp. TaxID=1978767 RepID=UPI002E0F51AE|nr:DNA translocase FtsK [Telluribacter sp.]
MPEKTPRGNSYRPKEKQEKPSGFQLSLSWEGLVSNPKSSLAWGVFFMLIGSLLEIAFLSYIFTGTADQSVVDGLGQEPLREAGRQTRNALGLFGATASHIFVYRWFGVAALALPLVPFLAGWKLVFGTELLPLARTTKEVVFYTLWVSVLMGYVVLMSGTEQSLSFLSGGVGYEANTLLFGILRWGSILAIAFVLFLWVVYFYDVTSLDLKKKPSVQPQGQEHTPVVPAPAADSGLADYASADYASADYASADYAAEPEAANTYRPLEEYHYDEEPDNALSGNALPGDASSGDASPEEASIVIEKPGVEDPEEEIRELFMLDRTTTPSEPPLILEVDDMPPLALPPDDDEEDISEKILREAGYYDPTIDLPKYQFPTEALLNEINESQQEKVSQEELEGNKTRIVDTLRSYGINIDKIKATIGPTVTLYEIIPEAGVRISKIKNLEGDIALSLAALGIRIIAPMPGRGTIGIEVPNKNRETVFIRSVLGSERFQKVNYDLPVVLGKTISNEIHIADLAKMPHLLMAGATGQGKSVGLNVILASLIYKKHPSQLKFVLVDPKKVELTLFNKLERHFLAKLPNSEEAIITDTKKVIYTLNSLCIEMDNRYDLLKEGAVRNIKEYNAKFVQRRLNPEKGHRFLPYIVLVIDELADLMMTAGKEVETPIARLAQLARAVGIHLVLATQRPSVKVITGLIKANFPARLSYRVTSSIDSRTILDTGGAEQLVGQGDMLLAINSDIVRLQCPFIDTREVEDICDFIGSQRGYEEAYALPEYEGEDGGEGRSEVNVEDFDQLLAEAARLIVTHQQGSTSLIQRKMKLGYNRAGRIMDQLEVIGVVGPFTGSKARDVLFHDLESLEQHIKSMAIA